MKILRASEEIAATWPSASNFPMSSGSVAPVRTAPARCSGSSPSTPLRSWPRRSAPRSSSGRQRRRLLGSMGAAERRASGASSSPLGEAASVFSFTCRAHALRVKTLADSQPKGMYEERLRLDAGAGRGLGGRIERPAGAGGDGEVVGQAERAGAPGRPRRPSRRCRCTSAGGGTIRRRPSSSASSGEAGAQIRVGGDAARDHERAAAPGSSVRNSAAARRVRSTRTSAAAAWKLAHRSFSSGGSRAVRPQPLDGLAQRGLEPGEREVAARLAEHRAGQSEAGRIAGARGALDRGPAGKAEPQHLGGLVERLAERVVEGRAEPAVAARRPRPRAAGSGRPRPAAAGRGNRRRR